MASRPSPVLADGMNQPSQRVNVDILEPAGREAHHVLVLAPAGMAARSTGKPRTRFLSPPVTSHGLLRGSRRCHGVLAKLCDAEQPGTRAGAWRGSVGEVAVLAAMLSA